MIYHGDLAFDEAKKVIKDHEVPVGFIGHTTGKTLATMGHILTTQAAGAPT